MLMSISANVLFYLVRAAFFIAVAVAGIVLGKKFRDKREKRNQ